MKKTEKISKNALETLYWSLNRRIVGIDEVGRGCLAGPVVAAAVMLPINGHYSLLKDSKIMSEAERAQAYAWITTHCSYALGIQDHAAIDHHNIYRATQKAMLKALSGLICYEKNIPGAIAIDAMPLTIRQTGLPAETEVIYAPKGESWSSSIAAASIVAKVWRDRLMVSMDKAFPGYFLANHKGYATPLHQKALLEQGSSLIHRQTFLSTLIMKKAEGEHARQQTIC